jgi:hypothetical protein
MSVVDAGAGRFIKYQVGRELDDALENPAFMSKWMDGKFTARERRVLITKWVGSAFDALCASGHIERYFTKTGCLLRTDNSQHNINIQGLPDYTFLGNNAPGSNFTIVLEDDSVDENTSSDDGDESAFDETDPESESDDDDKPIKRKQAPGSRVTRTWEDINPQLHDLGVEASTNPAKWPIGNQQKAITLLKEYLQENPNDGIANYHLKRLLEF